MLESMDDPRPARSSDAWRGQSKGVVTRGLLQEDLLWGIMWRMEREVSVGEIGCILEPEWNIFMS